jgi:hypothetical protein
MTGEFDLILEQQNSPVSLFELLKFIANALCDPIPPSAGVM